jgi:DNA-binding PucR family transcriptional regulator
MDSEEIGRRAQAMSWPSHVSLVVGEAAEGIEGWRLTHRQALAALPVVLRGRQTFTRYADVSLIASMLRDDILTSSLRELYLDPLTSERDGGATLRRTLRAYFSSERNVSSTAAVLGVSRKTVTNRLHVVDERLGRPLSACTAEMEAALRLQQVNGS